MPGGGDQGGRLRGRASRPAPHGHSRSRSHAPAPVAGSAVRRYRRRTWRRRASPWKNSTSRGSTTYRVQLSTSASGSSRARSQAASEARARSVERVEDLALVADQGGGEGPGRAGVQVGGALGGGARGDGAPDADLAALRRPVEAECGVGAGGDLAALRAGGVRGEVPAALVHVVQHQRPYVGQAVGVRGGQVHGVRLGLSGRDGLGEPGEEQGVRRGRRALRAEGGEIGVPDALGVQQIEEGLPGGGIECVGHTADATPRSPGGRRAPVRIRRRRTTGVVRRR